jgi:alpha-L-fucosidase
MKIPTLSCILAAVALAAPATTAVAASNAAVPESARADRARKIVLPKSDGHYRTVKGYVEDVPDADYIHAPVAAHEAFRDIKFSIRIHWGVYAMWNMEASWPYLRMSNQKKAEYNGLYKKFNPVDFDADSWMAFFKRCGMQAFAFTTKHHDGFSMFHTKTRVKSRANYLAPKEEKEKILEDCDLAYSIEETPFKRDIVKELCDAAHKNGIKINLYYSHPDWYDADFRPYVSHPLARLKRTPVEKERLIARHREQLKELLTNYGKIDMICLDMWLGKDIWPQTKETIKMLRKLQSDVMIRARGIGNYGDYFQPEQFVPGDKENTNMPWMSICLLGKKFSYDSNAKNYKGTKWVVRNLVDCAAKGGSFMVCIGPDAAGRFHPEAVRQLEGVGDWLKINGEGIYETRARDIWAERDFKFTRSKDNKRVYAFSEQWPGKKLVLKTISPKSGSAVFLLGVKEPLKWKQTDAGVEVEIPAALQDPENRPCEYLWTFRFEI